MYDVIIAGAGPAGLTAGIYTSRGGFSALVVERAFAGGQMALSYTIENYPGLEKVVPGAQLAHDMKQQAQREGAEIVTEDVTSLELTGRVKKVITSKNTYEGKAVILAMGAVPRLMNIPGEKEFAGSGVSYCATCDGAFFKEREVAVVGGGNTALEDAMFLSMYCKKVYLIHRRDQFRGQNTLAERARSTPNIELLLDTIPVSIEGEFSASKFNLKNVKTGNEFSIDIAGVFVAIGQIPKTQLVEGVVDLDAGGYIIAGEDCRTKLPGVFCAGDLRTKSVRQIVTAAADGAVAGIGVEQYLLNEY